MGTRVKQDSHHIRHRAAGHGVGVPSGPLTTPLSLSPRSRGVISMGSEPLGPNLPGRGGLPRVLSRESFGPKRAPRRAKRAQRSTQD
eukprot:1361832-Pyramimonas_sp.AAC.1